MGQDEQGLLITLVQRGLLEGTVGGDGPSNLELGSIPPLFLSQLGRSRWPVYERVN